MADPDVEWEQRRLCPDGSCIGVIGADGRCNVCGMLAPESGGPFRATPLESEADVDVVEAAPPAGVLEGEELEEERELCSDDACIGLIGPDGRCKECGKPRAA